MKIRAITLSALASTIALSLQAQTAPVAAPSVAPAQPVPSFTPGLQQQQLPARPATGAPGIHNRNGQIPGQPNQVPMRGALGAATDNAQVVMEDRAVTASDQTLLTQVRLTMQTRVQNQTAWAPVHFEVANGVVTIVGSVQNPALKQQIETVVRQTPGVIGVVDQLSMGTATSGLAQTGVSGPDQKLLLRVRQTVLPQIQVGGAPVPIDFTAQQGVVTISGTVPNIQQQHLIANLVQRVPGVVQVKNQLQLRGAVAAPLMNTAAGTQPNNTQGTVQTNLVPTGRLNGTVLPGIPSTNAPAQ